MSRRRQSPDIVSDDDLENAKNDGALLQARYDKGEARRPEVFARNLDRLAQMHGLTRKEVAEKIGTNYQWFRRIVTRGLTRISGKNMASLERLATFFNLGSVDEFWNPNLIEFRVEKPGLDRDADPYTHFVWRQQKFWPYARKLAHILATGKHEYLKNLIDALYKTVPQDGFRKPEPGAGYWSSSDGEDAGEDD